MVEIGCRDAQTNTILNFPGWLVQSLYVNISRTTTLPSYSSICFLNASWNRLEQGPPLVKTNCGLVHVTANLLFHILRTVLHVFYRLARFNSSSRRYFNSSPILQAGCNYSLCSPNQTLTGWGMTSHWEAIKLKLIHKNSTYPLYPLKTEILTVGTHLLLTSSSVLTTISINSQLLHGPQDQTGQLSSRLWAHLLRSSHHCSGSDNLLLPWPFCSNHHHSQISEYMTHSCHSVMNTYVSSTWKPAPKPPYLR